MAIPMSMSLFQSTTPSIGLDRLRLIRYIPGMHYKEVIAKFDDPLTYVEWQTEIGIAEVRKLMDQAFLDMMAIEGTRAILPVVEKIRDVTAILEEYVVE